MILASVRSSWPPSTTREARRMSLLHERDVGLDPLDRRLDQHRVVHRRQQAQAVPGGPDAGNPQNVGAAALNWKIAD